MRNPKHRRQFAIVSGIGIAALCAAGFLTGNDVFYAAAIIFVVMIACAAAGTYRRWHGDFRPEWFGQALLFILSLFAIALVLGLLGAR